jgi:thiol-disulfide isomerase/thioredoxin
MAKDSKDIDWDAYKGKVVYIDFWASWCGPCRESFPWMNAMQQKYSKDGLVILAVNVDTDKASAAKFLATHPAQFDIWYDPKGELAKQFAVQTMPSSFVLGRDGKPAAKHNGFHQKKIGQYETELQQLLAQKP